MTASADRLMHDEVSELLGAYALDALDPNEKALVEAHLRGCPRCAGEVAAHHEVAGLLANTGSDAPAELWNRISERLGAPGSANWEKLAARLDRPEGVGDLVAEGGRATTTARAGDSHPASPVVDLAHRRRTRRAATWAATAVATAAAVLAVVFGIRAADLNNQVAQLHAAQNQPGLAHAAQLALADPTTEQVRLLPAGAASPGGPSVTVAITPEGTAYLIPRNLPRLPSDQTYQLWGKPDSQMISFGLLGANPTTTMFTLSPKAPVALLAITIEPAGGVVQPTHPPILQGPVTA